MKTTLIKKTLVSAFSMAVLTASGYAEGMVSAQTMADAIHAVVDSDRTVYTQKIINRLAVEEKVIKASEHWEDDVALVLPAQMLRYGGELAVEKQKGKFSYSLLSLWPINPQNAPKTDAEKAGLEFVAKNIGQNYYTTETLGGKKYFTGVYADIAIAKACVSCHNEHKDSPKTDFKMADVMGGLVVRIPVD